MAGFSAIGYTGRMKCPNCGAQAPSGAADCPGCGVIFAKLAEREARKKAEAKAQAALLDAPPAASAPGWDPKKLRVAAIAIVAVWLIVLAVSVRRSIHQAKTAGGTQHPAVVGFTDPRTGEYKQLPLKQAAPAARPAAVNKPAPPPDTWDAGWIEEDGKRKK